MKLSIRVLLLVLPLLMLTVNSCKKDDGDQLPAASYTTTAYTNQTGNPNANALMLHVVNNNDHSVLNFYGTFDLDGNPTKLSSVVFQKENNDTTIYYLLNDTTGRLETSYFSVAGIKNPIVFKYNYIQGNDHAFIFSIHQYDWSQNSDSLIYQTTVENNNGTVTSNPSYMAKTTDLINWPSAIAAGFAIVDMGVAVTGGTSIIVGPATASIIAAASAPFVATTIGIIAVVAIGDFLLNNANASVPTADAPPQGTPITSPVNDPTPNLQPIIIPPVMTFGVTMDQFGTIMFSNINGGTPPYQFSVGQPVSWQSSWTFPNNYSENTYLVAVKDADNRVCAKVIPLAPVGNDCSSLNVTANRVGKTITASATGGTAPYQYKFANNYMSQDFSNDNTFDLMYDGRYYVIVRDVNGCTDTLIDCVSDVSITEFTSFPSDSINTTPSGVLKISYTSSLGLIPEFMRLLNGDYKIMDYIVTSSNSTHYTSNLADLCDGGGFGGFVLASDYIEGNDNNRTVYYVLMNDDNPLGGTNINVKLLQNCGGTNPCQNPIPYNRLYSQERTIHW